MPSYVALLRAINVGGRMYKMADLRAHLETSGLTEVETYIQTGNVRFRTAMRSAPKVEAHVERAVRAGRGLDVPAIIMTPDDLVAVYADAMALEDPFGSGGGSRYISFFKEPVSSSAAQEIEAYDVPGERGWVRGRVVHVWIDGPMMEANFFNVFKKPLAPGTNRNLKVVAALAERWGPA